MPDNPDNMLNIRLYEVDLQMLTTLLRDTNGRLNNLESALAAIFSDVRGLWSGLGYLSQRDRVSTRAAALKVDEQ